MKEAIDESWSSRTLDRNISTSGLPKLSPASVETENIDAISRKGDRYI